MSENMEKVNKQEAEKADCEGSCKDQKCCKDSACGEGKNCCPCVGKSCSKFWRILGVIVILLLLVKCFWFGHMGGGRGGRDRGDRGAMMGCNQASGSCGQGYDRKGNDVDTVVVTGTTTGTNTGN